MNRLLKILLSDLPYFIIIGVLLFLLYCFMASYDKLEKERDNWRNLAIASERLNVGLEEQAKLADQIIKVLTQEMMKRDLKAKGLPIYGY